MDEDLHERARSAYRQREWASAYELLTAADRTSPLPMYEFTADLASLEPAPPELQQLLAAVGCDQEAMDGFARVVAG